MYPSIPRCSPKARMPSVVAVRGSSRVTMLAVVAEVAVVPAAQPTARSLLTVATHS